MPATNIPTSALVTGGADGLGKAICRRLIQLGVQHVAVLDVDRAKGQALSEGHPEVNFTPFDLAAFTESDLETAASGISPFDTVICNAGISACGNFKDTPSETEENVFEVNLLGHMRLVKALLRRRWIEKGGRLAFTISASVFTPFPLAVAYAASKAGLDGFANALEPYLIPEKISISRIYPGTMRTAHQQKYYAEMDPSTGSDPNQVAKKVVAGILKRKRHIYPDKMAKAFRAFSKIAPWAMPSLSHKATRKYGDILYPETPGKGDPAP